MTKTATAARRQIDQIVRLAQSATIPGEKDAAWGRVDALCRRHGIDRAEYPRPGEPARPEPSAKPGRRAGPGSYARTHEYGRQPSGGERPFTRSFNFDDLAEIIRQAQESNPGGGDFFAEAFRNAKPRSAREQFEQAGRAQDFYWHEPAGDPGPRPSDFRTGTARRPFRAGESVNAEDVEFETASQAAERQARERAEAEGRLQSAAAYLGALDLTTASVARSPDIRWAWPGSGGAQGDGYLLAEAQRLGWTAETDVDPALRARLYAKDAAAFLGIEPKGPPWWYTGRRLGDWQLVVVALAAGWTPREPWEGGR
jgi:hypothetical protein